MHDDKTILLVEDEQKDEALTLRALRRHNVANNVVVAHDGVEALDYLFRRGNYAERSPDELPEIILLDLKLPRLDGLEVLRQVRADARTRLIPVVILTSSDEDRDRLAGYELGANSYVRKPIDFTDFAEAVRNVGVYWLLLNRPAPRASRRQ
jgi:CheY-like chemotaxis protein